MVLNITGKDNKTLKLIRSLKNKKHRSEEGLFVAEGKRIVLEAFEYAPQKVWCVVVSESFLQKEPEIVKEAQTICEKAYSVPDAVFADISDTDTPQGILVVMEMPKDEDIEDRGNGVIVLDGVAEPGNMGTIIRTAEAFGFDGIYLMKGCTDIYSSKTVRSTMGSIFRMNFKRDCTAGDVAALREKGFTVVSAALGGREILEKMAVPKKAAIVIGNEAHGISEKVLMASDTTVEISMDGLAESLNAAVAAAITMHWIKNSGNF